MHDFTRKQQTVFSEGWKAHSFLFYFESLVFFGLLSISLPCLCQVIIATS